jgi:hypothetical protein
MSAGRCRPAGPAVAGRMNPVTAPFRQCAARVAALAMFTAITNAWKNVKTMRATITPNGRRRSQVLRRLIIDHTPLGEANYGTNIRAAADAVVIKSAQKSRTCQSISGACLRLCSIMVRYPRSGIAPFNGTSNASLKTRPDTPAGTRAGPATKMPAEGEQGGASVGGKAKPQ